MIHRHTRSSTRVGQASREVDKRVTLSILACSASSCANTSSLRPTSEVIVSTISSFVLTWFRESWSTPAAVLGPSLKDCCASRVTCNNLCEQGERDEW